jgi:carbon-monoxide dehydrogenase small subunit
MHTLDMEFTLNERALSVHIPANMMLVDLLRDELGFTGTKVGCRMGECGVCTVLVDDIPVNSCIFPAAKVHGRSITTIEGVESEHGELDEMQVAFVSEGAVQCGFCTPAMVLNAKAFVEGNLSADEAQIRNAISGVLCRCTGYQKIVDAVRTVVEEKIGCDDEAVMQAKSGSKRGPMP